VATAGPPAVGRHAAADQHPGPVGGAAARQLSNQACLADASLAPHQDDGRFAIYGPPSDRVEGLELLDTADESQARHAAAHLAGIILCDRSEGSAGRRGRRPKDGEPASAEVGTVPDSGPTPRRHSEPVSNDQSSTRSPEKLAETQEGKDTCTTSMPS